MRQRVGFLIADHVVVGSDSLRGGVGATIADSQLCTQLATFCFLLGRCLGVGFLVLCSSVVIFPDGIESVGLLQSLISATTHEEHGADDDGAYLQKNSHTL